MPGYLYHGDPDILVFETEIVDSRPGAVVLERSWLHPGGGGSPTMPPCGMPAAPPASPESRSRKALVAPARPGGPPDGRRVGIDADHRSRLAAPHR